MYFHEYCYPGKNSSFSTRLFNGCEFSELRVPICTGIGDCIQYMCALLSLPLMQLRTTALVS